MGGLYSKADWHMFTAAMCNEEQVMADYPQQQCTDRSNDKQRDARMERKTNKRTGNTRNDLGLQMDRCIGRQTETDRWLQTRYNPFDNKIR